MATATARRASSKTTQPAVEVPELTAEQLTAIIERHSRETAATRAAKRAARESGRAARVEREELAKKLLADPAARLVREVPASEQSGVHRLSGQVQIGDKTYNCTIHATPAKATAKPAA